MLHRVFRCCSCILVLSALAGAELRAQVGDTAVAARRLPPIAVTSSLLPRMSPDVSSASGSRAFVLDDRLLALRGTRFLSTVLETNGGATMYDDLGSRFKPTLTMRGFFVGPVVGLPQGVSVFLDGIPVNEVDAGQANLELLPIDDAQQVELFSGTAALLGPNTMGGAVNLVTRQGSETGGGALSLGYGSYGGVVGNGSVSGARGDWRMHAGGAVDHEEGWRQQTESRAERLLVNMSRRHDESGLHLQLLAARSNAATAGSLPESVYGVRPDSNFTPGDFEALSQLHVAGSHVRVARDGHLRTSVWLRDHSAERFNVNQVADPDVRAFSRTRTGGALLHWQGDRAVGRWSTSLRAGAGGSVNHASIQIHAERIDPGLTTHVETPITRGDAFLETWAQRGAFTASGGLRQDIVRVPFRNRIDPRRDTTSVFGALNPRASLSLHVGALRGWASWARGFRAPAVIEIACADPEEPCPLPFALGDDPPIHPVRSRTGEVGASWQWATAQASATVFRTDVRDEIVLLPYEDANEPEASTIDGFFANIPRTRRTGYDMSLRAAFPGIGSLSARYARTAATFQSTGVEIFSIREDAGGENEIRVGSTMPMIPERTWHFSLTATPVAPLRVVFDTRYTGQQWLRGDEANETAPLSPYWLSDLHATYRIGAWDVQASVRNLFDAEYVAFGTWNVHQDAGGLVERFLTPGTPRMVRLSITRHFGGDMR